MPQFGEPVTVSLIVDDSWECPFAHGNTEPTVSNLLSNNGIVLGKNMDAGVSTSKREPTCEKVEHPEIDLTIKKRKIKLDAEGFDLRIKMNAHHLIPGKASLPKSNLMDYVAADRGVIRSDIGYVVNGAQNGVWLPSNNAVAGWGDLTVTRSDGVAKLRSEQDVSGFFLQRDYAFVAMEISQAQFHDTHLDYNEFLIKCLNKLFLKCWVGTKACDKCKAEEKMPPPYALISRLNAISDRMRKHLLFPYQTWRAPVNTSAWALDFQAHYRLRSSR